MKFLEPRFLIFELPLLLALLYGMGMALSGHHGDTDVGHADTDLDHDIDARADYIGHEHDPSTHESGDSFMKAFSFLGVGKVPISIVLTTLFTLWGVTGIAVLLLIEEVINFPFLSLPVAFVAAFIVSLFGTARFSRVLVRLLPRDETYAVSQRDLVGHSGTVRYEIKETFGSVQVYDQYGTLHEVECRTKPGETTIPSGTKVVLVGYDRERKVFSVITEAQVNVYLEGE